MALQNASTVDDAQWLRILAVDNAAKLAEPKWQAVMSSMRTLSVSFRSNFVRYLYWIMCKDVKTEWDMLLRVHQLAWRDALDYYEKNNQTWPVGGTWMSSRWTCFAAPGSTTGTVCLPSVL